jgi:hypothetical protein
MGMDDDGEEAAETSSLAALEGDGESIVEDCGPEHWLTVMDGSGSGSGSGTGQTPVKGSLLDVSELASPQLLREAAVPMSGMQGRRDAGTPSSPSSPGRGGGRLFCQLGDGDTPSPGGPPPVTTHSIERSHVFRQDALAHGARNGVRMVSSFFIALAVT